MFVSLRIKFTYLCLPRLFPRHSLFSTFDHSGCLVIIKKQFEVSFSCVYPLTDDKLRHNTVKV